MEILEAYDEDTRAISGSSGGYLELLQLRESVSIVSGESFEA